MDKLEKFKNDLHTRQLNVIENLDYDSWTDYDTLCNAVNKEAIKRHPGIKAYKGRPCRTRSSIKFLIKIGCVEAHPQYGLRLNKDFEPTT